MKDYTKQLVRGQDLSSSDMRDAIEEMMSGKASQDEMKAFLLALSEKGETGEEIAAAAKVMREHAITIKAPYDALDCCGTGGDGAGTYNISTAVSLVLAACGVPIAKHGNRASSSKSGTADVLEELGVNLTMPPEALEQALAEYGFAFLMAPNHHGAMKHVAAVRKEIGQRTIFNCLGPLLNPAGTRFQLLGVYSQSLLEPMASALKMLGSKAAWVVHGSDGLDEITLTGETYCTILDERGEINYKTLIPDDFGLPTYTSEDLKGGDVSDNAKALRGLLDGQKGAYRDITLANAAAALMIAGKCETLAKGVRLASESIDSGLADALLSDYIQFSRQYIDN